jgi:hypothetical protein
MEGDLPMHTSLVPCPKCTRHVRVSEKSCPFCKSALADDALATAVVPGATQRLTRAAAYAFTASLAVTGCAGSTTGGTTDGGAKDGTVEDSGGGQALYGAPAPDGGFQPPYGSPPIDDGGAQPMYGAVPADSGPDSGPADGGGSQPLYGAPADSGHD